MENNSSNSNNNDNQEMTNPGLVTMGNLNSVANWVSATVISAFFSSLERFSCVNVATFDPDDDDDEEEEEANDRPLAISSNPHDVSNLPV